MDKKFWVLGIATSFLLAAGTARAQSVDEKIKTLEQELTQLKEQQSNSRRKLRLQRPRYQLLSIGPAMAWRSRQRISRGAFASPSSRISATSLSTGATQQGRTSGELMGRRFRPGILYCINNCLWEIEATLDLDGFGTGNGKNSLNTGTSSVLQRGAVNFHAENLNPFLPTVQFGMEVQNAFGSSLSRQGSGSVGAQAEYDLVSRNNGFNTGRAGQGVVLNWQDRELSAIGIPGRIGLFQLRRVEHRRSR
jgi:hypothetical protein